MNRMLFRFKKRWRKRGSLWYRRCY